MHQLPDGEYFIYLRKSRADLESEARGEGETLSKHRNELFRLAKRYNVNITEVFEEIVSGESLYHRTEMLQMLKKIEERRPEGVLCMDMDRLGRGNMQEQGLILETFRKAGTKIITPRKVYDLNDEFDEEYSEFEAFMARKELKIINRRLQGGRIRSIQEGNYIGTRPPYGYLIEKNDRGARYLVPHPEQAPAVQSIFDWYTHPDPKKRMGSKKIATKLNEMNIKSYTGKLWEASAILAILKNEVYIGQVVWKKVYRKKSKDPLQKTKSRTRPRSEWIVVKGKHESLITEEVFARAQEILKNRSHIPYQLDDKGNPKITAPLAGLIKCDVCEMTMVYRPYSHTAPYLRCPNSGCVNVSSRYEFVESKLIEGLKLWLRDYEVRFSSRHKKDNNNATQFMKQALTGLEKELVELETQKGNLHDLLERGIYDAETYLERSRTLAERISETTSSIQKTRRELELELKREQAQVEVIPKVKSVLSAYVRTKDPVKKNALLKSVISHARYRKEKNQRMDEFTLVLVPLI